MNICKRATVAPLVLLSVVDHFKRHNSPRVVGVLLGSNESGCLKITNSFAIPFEEFEETYFIDTSYLMEMFELFYKVNVKETIVGWYHSGPKMFRNDVDISRSFKKYCDNPVLAVVNVSIDVNDIPIQLFQLQQRNELTHISVQIGADETEEVGVEHLLRDIKEGTGSSLKDQVNQILDSLKMYKLTLNNIIEYIERVENGESPEFKIIEMMQNIINEIPKIYKDINLNELYSIELINTMIAMNDYQDASRE